MREVYKVIKPVTKTGRELADSGIDKLIMLPGAVKEFALANRFNARMFKGFALIGDEVWGMSTMMLQDKTVCTRLK